MPWNAWQIVEDHKMTIQRKIHDQFQSDWFLETLKKYGFKRQFGHLAVDHRENPRHSGETIRCHECSSTVWILTKQWRFFIGHDWIMHGPSLFPPSNEMMLSSWWRLMNRINWFLYISSIWDGLGGPRMFYLAHLMDKCAKLTGTPRNFSALNLNWVLDAFEIQPYLPQVTGTLFWETFACTTTIKKPGTNCIKNFQDQNNIDLWWSYRGPFFVVPRATVFLFTSSWSLY